MLDNKPRVLSLSYNITTVYFLTVISKVMMKKNGVLNRALTQHLHVLLAAIAKSNSKKVVACVVFMYEKAYPHENGKLWCFFCIFLELCNIQGHSKKKYTGHTVLFPNSQSIGKYNLIYQHPNLLSELVTQNRLCTYMRMHQHMGVA